ncbi:hypothetical protein [Bernardetia sp. MNP-M8]|uniref:hypothetical protein n=1 Tax=Bernardetia sp. MNP-M8 TaxID=3127470 RepID=UPI0030CECE4C
MTTTTTTTTTITTVVEECCNEQNKTVIGECVNNVIYLPCPFTDENGVCDTLSIISVYKQNYTAQSPNAMVSMTEQKICAIERGVGLNLGYRIELENVEDGKYQVVFASAKYVPHDPPAGFGGAQPIGDIG